MATETDYQKMQREYYNNHAARAKYDQAVKQEGVVGSYHMHDDWFDYDRYILRHVDDSFKSKLALEFGCGPGRNIVRWHHLFKRIDGCDIAENNLKNAVTNLTFHGVSTDRNFYVTSGTDCGKAPANTYDFVYSTICLQHICVHSVRYKIFQDIYRVLRVRGRLSAQMGFGSNSPKSVGYYDNNVGATDTNRGCDTRVENSDELEQDLHRIGFKDFDFWIRPTGPGDTHPYWIYFTAVK